MITVTFQKTRSNLCMYTSLSVSITEIICCPMCNSGYIIFIYIDKNRMSDDRNVIAYAYDLYSLSVLWKLEISYAAVVTNH